MRRPPPSLAHRLAGCGKSLRSLLPLSYLPQDRGRRLRKAASFHAGCYCVDEQCRPWKPFFGTLLIAALAFQSLAAIAVLSASADPASPVRLREADLQQIDTIVQSE